MFPDPTGITYNAVGVGLNRTQVLVNPPGAVYQSPDGVWKLTVTHQDTNKKRIRTRVRLDRTVVVVDQLDNTKSDFETITIETILDRPILGFSMVDVERLFAVFTGTVSDSARLLNTTIVDKLYGRES